MSDPNVPDPLVCLVNQLFSLSTDGLMTTVIHNRKWAQKIASVMISTDIAQFHVKSSFDLMADQ
jgi:hypothetical protein